MLDWNKCVRSLEGSPVRKTMAWKGETGSVEILPMIAQGPRFNPKDPNHLDQLFSWMELPDLQGLFSNKKYLSLILKWKSNKRYNADIYEFFLLSVSRILLNLSCIYDGILQRKFTILCNTEGTARTNVSVSKQKNLSYIPSKLPFIISLKHGYILKILLVL